MKASTLAVQNKIKNSVNVMQSIPFIGPECPGLRTLPRRSTLKAHKGLDRRSSADCKAA